MKHQSFRQYVYSLYALLFAMALAPITVIALVYYVEIKPVDFENDLVWFFFACIAVADVIFFEYLYRKRLNRMVTTTSLAARLAAFHSLTTVRFAGINFSLTLLAAGYLLLREELLTWLFLALLLYESLHWPTPSVIGKALRLSASEQEALKAWK